MGIKRNLRNRKDIDRLIKYRNQSRNMGKSNQKAITIHLPTTNE
jgi:hypothetical protein